jgi:hypothetical protein
MQRYLLILDEYEHSHIYHVDVSVVDEGAYIDGDGLIDLNFEFLEEEYRERVCITETFKYDMITVVTQDCINNHFRRLWKASRLIEGDIFKWSYDKSFDATFGPIQIRLPHDSSSRKVTLFLTLETCEFALLDCFRGFTECVLINFSIITLLTITYSREMTEKFGKWRIAFEVKLEQYPKNKISDEYLSGDQFVNYQLILDLNSECVVVVSFDLCY